MIQSTIQNTVKFDYPHKILNFVNGDFVEPSGHQYFEHTSPHGEFTTQIAQSQAIDLIKALQLSHNTFEDWKISNFSDRKQLALNVKSYLEKHQNEIAALEAVAQGMRFKDSLDCNVKVAISKLNHFIEEFDSQTDSHYTATGVIVVVLSWNFSTRLFVESVLPAILAGNTVIVKPSTHSAVTTQIWGQLFQVIQAPKSLVQILNGTDVAFKNLLISHPGVKAILSYSNLEHAAEIHLAVARQSRQMAKKIQINSGSKNITAVVKELTENEMNQVLQSFLVGQGQLHWNSGRLFVLEKYEKNWTEFIETKLNELRPSQSIFDDSLWTPIQKQKSKTDFNSIMSLAKKDQAKLISSQQEQNDPRYLKPFFTKDMSNCSTLQQDQVEAPAFILSTVKYPFDIAKYSNVSYYGFAAEIWTEVDKNQKLIHQVEVGNVILNHNTMSRYDLNLGVKQSMYGSADRRIFGGFYSNVKKLMS